MKAVQKNEANEKNKIIFIKLRDASSTDFNFADRVLDDYIEKYSDA